LRVGQLSKRKLLLEGLLRTAAGRPEGDEVAAVYRRLAHLNRRAPATFRALLLHPYLDEGLARAILAVGSGDTTARSPEREGPSARALPHHGARLDLRWLEQLAEDPYHDPWSRVRADCDGRVLDVRIADSGPFRDVHTHPGGPHLAPPLAAEQADRWADMLDAAWRVLVRRHPWHAEAMSGCLTTVVPLLPDSDGTTVSSAARRAYGAVAASLPDDPVLLALTLVHEFLHIQLGALLDLLPLHGPPTDARHPAPWRPEPRPVGALLQGTYAHLGVTDFWRTEVSAGTGGRRARQQYAMWREHTDTAAGTLLGSGELLPVGIRFVREMRHAVRERRPSREGRLRGRPELIADLRQLGLKPGDIVLVHASLRRIGPVEGGAEALVSAIMEVLGPTGTLVAYTQTPDNSDPSRWYVTRGYTVPEEAWPEARAAVPPFDPDTTPSYAVGVLPEIIRTTPAAVRSTHPQSSFAAVGADAAYITADHASDCHLGEESPLARLEKLDARVLLLGVGYDVCTAFHLAEYRVPDRPHRTYSCVVSAPPPAGRAWYHYEDVVLDPSRFGELGEAYEAEHPGVIERGRVGDADCRLFDLGGAVSYAADWLAREN
jgi:aminoglycoside N3'-acetyltransferase